MDRNEVMARVHGRFAMAEPELTNGFAEHATMGAEAMLSMGIEPSTVLSWASQHQPTPIAAGSPAHAIRATVAAELADEDWHTVLRRRAEPLTARLDAHLFHGLIRTAHAVRALGVHDDEGARAELATGLAAWTVWAGDGRREPPTTPATTTTDPHADLLEMARRGAAAFTAAPSIMTIHAVTAPMAYLLLADHLDVATHAVALSVFERTHRRHALPPARPVDRPAPGPAELATLAQRWDAHPAKLVEAALRGYASRGDAVFLDAVATMMA